MITAVNLVNIHHLTSYRCVCVVRTSRTFSFSSI